MAKIGIGSKSLVATDLKHGSAVRIVDSRDAGRVVPDADALLTKSAGVFLSITVADCLPVFLYDPVNNCVGLIHAGWRGLAKNIIPKTIQKMRSEFKSGPENVLVRIGPGIGVCHFEVKKDLLEKFKNLPAGASVKKHGKHFLNLKKIARRQLETAGLKKNNIETSGDCTYDLRSKYFSYRRDKPEFIETMMAVIGIKKPQR